MNMYVKINGVKYSITDYSYRLNSVNSDTQVSHIFTCTVVSDTAIVSEGDQIEFYSDDILIYSDPINSVIQNGFKFSIKSDKTINVVASKMLNKNNVIFFSSDTIRTSLNFDILPLDQVTITFGTFTARTVTHYEFYSEFTYG